MALQTRRRPHPRAGFPLLCRQPAAAAANGRRHRRDPCQSQHHHSPAQGAASESPRAERRAQGIRRDRGDYCLLSPGSGLFLINRELMSILFVDPRGRFMLGLAIAQHAVGYCRDESPDQQDFALAMSDRSMRRFDFDELISPSGLARCTSARATTCILVLALAAACWSALNLWRIGASEDRQNRLLRCPAAHAAPRLAKLTPSATPALVPAARNRWSRQPGSSARPSSRGCWPPLVAAGIKGMAISPRSSPPSFAAAQRSVPLCWLLLEWRQFFVGATDHQIAVAGRRRLLGWRFPEVVLSRLAAQAARASRNRHARRARSSRHLRRGGAQPRSRDRAGRPRAAHARTRRSLKSSRLRRRKCASRAVRSQALENLAQRVRHCEPAQHRRRAQPVDQFRHAAGRVAAGSRRGDARRASGSLRRACGAASGPFDLAADGVHPAVADDRDRHAFGAAHHRHAWGGGREGTVCDAMLRPERVRQSVQRATCAGIFGPTKRGASATIVAIALPGLIGFGRARAPKPVFGSRSNCKTSPPPMLRRYRPPTRSLPAKPSRPAI